MPESVPESGGPCQKNREDLRQNQTRRTHGRTRRTHARARRECWKTASSGEPEVCEMINPSNSNRDSNKGIILRTSLTQSNEYSEEFSICFLGGKILPQKVIPNPALCEFTKTFIIRGCGDRLSLDDKPRFGHEDDVVTIIQPLTQTRWWLRFLALDTQTRTQEKDSSSCSYRRGTLPSKPSFCNNSTAMKGSVPVLSRP